jgi:hypothetical protein
MLMSLQIAVEVMFDSSGDLAADPAAGLKADEAAVGAAHSGSPYCDR